jgi:hypothetical protein
MHLEMFAKLNLLVDKKFAILVGRQIFEFASCTLKENMSQLSPIETLKSFRRCAIVVIVSLFLGGCATGNFIADKADLNASITPATISVLSSQEEQLLKDATERAQRLHQQLRELESRNVTIVRRLPLTTNPAVLASDRRLALGRSGKLAKGEASSKANRLLPAEQPVVVTEKLEPQVKFAVEFAVGSAALIEPDRAELVKNLGVSNPSVFKIGGSAQTSIILELTTYKRQGLDQLNNARMKSIVEALTNAGVPAQVIQIKIGRVASRTAENAAGSASRVVRITRLNASAIRS